MASQLHARSAFRGPGLRLLALVVLSACGTTRVPGPEDAVRRYQAAVRSGDARSAYETLDERTQREVSFEAFRADFEGNADELRTQADAIDEALREERLRSRAEVPLSRNEVAVLTLDEGQWRLVGGVLDAPALLTPMDAVLALRHALLRRDMNGLMRVLARATRSELEADLQRMVQATEDLLDLQVDEEGDRARVRTTAGPTLVLRREASEWRIVDIQP
ncbi:MAG: hypothetical protein AAF411_31095 [Myxococcota bacterium]